MKIEAIETIIEWDDGRMVVLNPGDDGELSDAKALEKIEAGQAKKAGSKSKKAQPDQDEDGEAGGSKAKAERKPRAAKAGADPELGEARKRYRAAFGKGAGPKWDVATIEAKIAEKAAVDDSDSGDGDEADAPPA